MKGIATNDVGIAKDGSPKVCTQDECVMKGVCVCGSVVCMCEHTCVCMLMASRLRIYIWPSNAFGMTDVIHVSHNNTKSDRV